MEPANVPPARVASESDLPSCEGCRKRKLKCSRRKPLCSNCERYDTPCVYEYRRNKPGLKAGAVESLNKRLEAVERHLFHRDDADDHDPVQAAPQSSSGSGQQTILNQSSDSDTSPVLNLLSTLAQEIHKLNSTIVPARHGPSAPRNPSSPKRRRLDFDESHGEPSPGETQAASSPQELPPNDILDEVLDVYFPRIHPWLPILSEAAFRRKLQSVTGRRRNHIVLHAMVVAALRLLRPEGQPLSREYIESTIKTSRNFILQTAMSGLSVENLQALTILAFNDIGNGESLKAWPVIGSLTRTVEYLQLSVEDEDRKKRAALLRPLPSLPKPSDWVEEEERRRVFWNIFILDRFCSVTTGWNTSLTATDVSRRLPVCGGLWYNETPAITPYFGIWSRSSATLGNSITFLPSHYPSPSNSKSTAGDTHASETPSTARHRARGESAIDMSKVGAFAYYIESIESLSRVNTYFLQQSIDFTDRHEVSSWLTRFKELDLRLVHWKMFLPSQWKDSGASRETMPGVMDPNMTVANATHNISMILLHQKIAYPDSELAGTRIPSSCSADTCHAAAVETANITKQYLDQTSAEFPVSPQLGFCAFVSARVLLAHWRFYGASLAAEFWTLVSNLGDMSRRWTGTPETREDGRTASVFSQFSFRLRCLHDRCMQDETFRIDVSGYSDDITWEDELLTPIMDDTATVNQPADQNSSLSRESSGNVPVEPFISDLQTGRALPMGSMATGDMRAKDKFPWITTANPPQEAHVDELTAISEVLADPSFMNMDRIISFEDMMLASGASATNSASIDGWSMPNGNSGANHEAWNDEQEGRW